MTLAVGDYAVGDRLVERKTVEDLHRSLVDGRIWSQVGALRRDAHRAYLLIEGVELDDGPVSSRALRGALLKTMDNGIRLIRASSPEDSALWLHVLAAQVQRRLHGRATLSLGRRSIVTSPVGLLAAIPGISKECATALLGRFGSVAAIASASETDLRSIPGVGPERAHSLIRALTRADI